MSQLKGAGGKPKTPPSPTNTPDNLRSEDTVELVLGLGEGPIKGLTNGHKSFNVGDTVLQRQDGDYNFEDFELKVFPGEENPEALTFKLGGEGSNNAVGVSLAYGVPVTRQTQTGNIDAIDVRLVVSSLYKSVQEGKNPGVFDNTFQFKIRYKPLSASTWGDWFEAPAQDPATGNPYTQPTSATWSNTSYQSGGTWYDPATPGRTWTAADFSNGILWWILHMNDVTPGGWTPPPGLFIKGKTTSTYVKEYRIPVQRIPEPYQIQVERMSPDSSLGGDPQYVAEVSWESFQEIDQLPKEYPNTALVQVVGRSTDQFSSIPQFSGIYDGLIVRVPTNYNPETRVYTGIWDGSWKNEWTNNPVWLLYEAIHNDRWGWSAYTPVSWSKFEAYELAKICDYILPSGKPRYTFNAFITDPMDGREFCRYLAGSFNSVLVDDNNGNVQVLMDKDDAAIAIVGPESIVGDFEYTRTDVKTRFNDMTVVFQNPDIDYNEDRRRVFDQDQIDQFGRITFDFIAVGCTDQNEAVRKATRRLISATTETEMVNFKTNRIASYWKPYDIILITDPNKGYGQSGRFKSWTGSTITLRDPIYVETGVAYAIDVQTKAGILSYNLTSMTTGWASTFTTTTTISADAGQKAQFSLKQAGGGYGLPKPYRIMELTENNGEPDDWSVMAIEVNRLKFAAEDEATLVGEPVYSFPIDREPSPPSNVLVTNLSRAAPDGTMLYEARVDFTPPDDAYVNAYYIRYRQADETEYEVRPVDGSGVTFRLPRDGDWEFQVQCRNVWSQQSLWVAPDVSPTSIDKIAPIVGGSLVSATGGLNQITVKVAYPDQTDIRYARIYAATTNNSALATYVGRTDSDTFIHNILSGVVGRYYWVKFQDNLENIGPFTAASNAGVYAVTTQITTPDIGNGVITPAAFAAGTTPIEIVSSLPVTGNFLGRTVTLTSDGKLYTWNGSTWETVIPEIDGVGVETVSVLPTTGNFEGRIVYLTTDDKLYRYTGSAWISAVAATDITGQVTGSQIADGAINIARLAAGLQPIEIVSSLPVTNLYQGRTVLLTTDNKLYRYTGSAWTAAVPTTDLTGTITGPQIAAGAVDITKMATGLQPVEIVASLPASGNYNGRVVMLTTDGKMYRYTSGAWTSAVPTTDLTGTITGPQITAAAIDATKFASGIRPVEIVSSLPASGNFQGRVVMLTTDNKLYRHTGSAWVATVPTTDLTGQITNAQLTDASVGMSKLAAGLQPVEIVATLPASGNYNGRVAILTTDGKVYRYISGAWTSAVPTVDLSGLVTGSQIAADTVTASNIAANAITSSELAANAVIAGKIAAGVITATEIATGAITASKLVVSDWTNLILDGDFVDSAYWSPSLTNATAQFAATTTEVTTGLGATRGYSFTPNGTAGAVAFAFTRSFLVEPGSTLRAYAKVLTKANSNSRSYLMVQFKTQNGSQIGNFPVYGTDYRTVPNGASDSVQIIDAQITVPSNAAYAFYFMWTEWAAAGTSVGATYFAFPRLNRAMSGSLVVDGAITAAKIATGTITATQIASDTITATQIAASAITSSELAANAVIAGKIAAGVITAAEIAAGAITASRLSITDNSNLVPDPNMIDPSSWSLASGTMAFADSDTGSNNFTSLKHIVATAAAGAYSFVLSRPFKVNEGDSIYVSSQARVSTGTGAATVHIYTSSQKDFLAGTTTDLAFLITTNTTTTVLSGSYTIPAGAKYCRIRVFKDVSGTSTEARFGGLIVRLRNKGELIVDGAITAAKIAANTITASQIAAGTITATQIATDTITATQIAANAITSSELSANAVIAGKIAAGVITATEIATGAITASKLLITDWANLVTNPTFSDITAWSAVAGATQVTQATAGVPSGMPYNNAVKLDVKTGNLGYAPANYTSRIAVSPGQVYYLEYWAASTASVNSYARGVLHFVDKDGAGNQWLQAAITASSANTTWTKYSGYVTVPATVPSGLPPASMMFSIDVVGTATPVGSWYVTNFTVRRANTGELIVDGAITATKIAAGTITATQIAGDTITAANIAANAITSSELAANSVIAGKIAAGVVTATEIASRTITASKLAIGDFSNLLVAGDLKTTTLDGWSRATAPSGSGINVYSNTTWPTTFAMALSRGATTGELSIVADPVAFDAGVSNGGIPTDTGEEYFFESTIYQSTPGAAVVDIVHRSPNGTLTSLTATSAGANTALGGTTSLVSGLTANTWGKFSGTFKNVSNGGGRIYVRVWNASTTNTHVVYYGGTQLRRKNQGELIVDGAITAAKIAANTITASQIATGTITATQIAAGTITGDRLVAGTITATQIATGTITATQIAAGTITATQIATNTITAAQISAGSITGDRLTAGTITATQIATGAITASMIGAGTITVSVNVGSTGKILLDGANNRIIISD